MADGCSCQNGTYTAMSNEINPNSSPTFETPSESTTESFGEMLAQFEQSHSHKAEGGARQLEGVVVSMDAESVYLDIGFKAEGILPRSAFENGAEGITAGDKFPVSVKGRNLEGYYELSHFRVTQPTDWSSLEEAFAQKSAVVGIVTGVVKGGITVDVGVRAFMPVSRSGVRDAAEMEKLVGQEITCRITKLDVTEEDVVVDRLVACLRGDDPVAMSKSALNVADLSARPGIFYDPARHPAAHERLVEMLAEAGIQVQEHSRVSHPSDLQQLVLEGNWVAFIRERTALIPGLTTRPIIGKTWTVDTAFIYRNDCRPETIPCWHSN